MKKNIDLLHEPILPALTRLALPIMATSLVQMAYNMTDMAWIGRVGAGAVSAVGSGGHVHLVFPGRKQPGENGRPGKGSPFPGPGATGKRRENTPRGRCSWGSCLQ